MTNPINRELEFYIQGAQSTRQMTAGSNRVARRFFKQAIAEKDDFARAHGYLSYSLLLAHLHGWKQADIAEDVDVTLDKVLQHAELARKHGPDDYENHWSLAAAHIYSKNFQKGMDSYEKALSLAETQAIPHNLSCCKVERADALIFNGNHEDIEKAVEIILGEMKLPDFPKTHLWALGWAYYELGAFESQKEKMRDFCLKSLKALMQIPNPHVLIRKNIAATYAALEWTEAAKVVGRELRGQLPPTYRVADEMKWPYGDDTRRNRWMSHLIAAGLPA
jgi:tetratricopeptide (TPR) repeat protein